MTRPLALLLCLCGAAPAQTFEVASIKPAAPPSDPHSVRVMMRGGPETPDPGQLTYTNVSLKSVLMAAYDVKDYEISGPSWLDSTRFNITAKIAPGTNKDQFRLMLQNLLAERFKVSLHHETKELPMFALVVGKSGVKMKEVVEEAAPPTDGDGPRDPLANGGRPPMGKDGMPVLPKGGRGGMMMTMGLHGGRFRMQANGQTMASLVNMLANQMGRPVVDQTGLTAKYDFTLDFAPEPGQGGMKDASMPMGGPGLGGDAGSDAAGPNILTAVQEQLGLKVEAKKGPVDLLVIDRAEKTPTEN
jgi:uncharacterized protein (TIGR03435 family)